MQGHCLGQERQQSPWPRTGATSSPLIARASVATRFGAPSAGRYPAARTQAPPAPPVPADGQRRGPGRDSPRSERGEEQRPAPVAPRRMSSGRSERPRANRIGHCCAGGRSTVPARTLPHLLVHARPALVPGNSLQRRLERSLQRPPLPRRQSCPAPIARGHAGPICAGVLRPVSIFERRPGLHHARKPQRRRLKGMNPPEATLGDAHHGHRLPIHDHLYRPRCIPVLRAGASSSRTAGPPPGVRPATSNEPARQPPWAGRAPSNPKY